MRDIIIVCKALTKILIDLYQLFIGLLIFDDSSQISIFIAVGKRYRQNHFFVLAILHFFLSRDLKGLL